MSAPELLVAVELLELLLDNWGRPCTDAEAPAPAPLGEGAAHARKAPISKAPCPLCLPDEELLEDFAIVVPLMLTLRSCLVDVSPAEGVPI